jgi:prepilin-type N-terminal cleavage/methylation domain-containing protein
MMTSRLMTSRSMTSEMTACGPKPRGGMLPSHADVPRIDERNMSIMSMRFKPTGFTLVELLVVIGVIAVLIAILLPVLSRARAQANRAVCLSNIRQLGVGILMYCNDNDGWFPTCARADDGLAFMHYPDDWLHWQANRNLDDSAVARYVGTGEKPKALLRCPADAFEGRKPRNSALPGQGPYLYSYGMNDALAENVRSGPTARTKIVQWRSPSRKILITEMRNPTSASWGYGAPLTWSHGTTRFHDNHPGFPDLAFGAKIGANVSAAFIDGHAEATDDNFANKVGRLQYRPEAQ